MTVLLAESGEKGYVLTAVWIFLVVGALMLIPALRLAYSTLNIKQLRTLTLQDQYARDGAAEHALWKLEYGGGTAELTEATQTIEYTIVLNGISTDVVIQLRAELNTPVMMAVGVTFSFVAGTVKRAPRAFQRLGLEWFWRLACEPRRLWRRYANNLAVFPWLVAREWLRGCSRRQEPGG